MDYSPWSEREIWPILKVAISPKPKKLCPPNLVCMHFTFTPIGMNFMSRFISLNFFADHGLFRKGNLAICESSNISETGEALPKKIGVHVFDINL